MLTAKQLDIKIFQLTDVNEEKFSEKFEITKKIAAMLMGVSRIVLGGSELYDEAIFDSF